MSRSGTTSPKLAIMVVLAVGLIVFPFFAWIALRLTGGYIYAAYKERMLHGSRTDPKQVAAVTKWLEQSAIPLKTVEPGHGFDDLLPLKDKLKDARIVALGEATHGSHEFFRFKHRMVEFLVKEMGFKVFAIEASYPACIKIDDYVLNGKGDRDTVLAGQGFWTWDTKEVAAMLDWMRDYNRSAPADRKVRFTGFDMQSSIDAAEALIPYLKRVDPGYAATAEQWIDPVLPPVGFRPYTRTYTEYDRQPKESQAETRARMAQVADHLAANRARLIDASSREEFDRALMCTRVLVQSEKLLSRDRKAFGSWAYRDQFMADNVTTLLDQFGPGTKMILWAHNGHIRTGGTGGLLASYDFMGGLLRRTYGKQYYALGLAFNQGEFRSGNADFSPKTGGLKVFRLPPAPQGSTEWFLALAHQPNYIVDLRSAPNSGQVADWLAWPSPMRCIGAAFSYNSLNQNPRQYITMHALRDQFDGVAYFDNVTGSEPIFRPAKRHSKKHARRLKPRLRTSRSAPPGTENIIHGGRLLCLLEGANSHTARRHSPGIAGTISYTLSA